MKAAVFREAALGQLRAADLELTPGRYVVLSNDRAPLAGLVALAAGLEPPRHGHVLLDGCAPASSPETRRKLASLFDDESLPPERTVLASIGCALEARGQDVRAAERVLENAGLAQLSALPPVRLAQRETRSVALALALAHEGAELLALHEPLATTIAKQYVLESLDQHTARGAIVLATTTSTADAVLLGGAWLCVELGRVRTSSGPAPRLGAGPWQQVLVEASDARALLLYLHDSQLELSAELVSAPHVLKVKGPALDVTVGEVIGLARRYGIEILRIEAAVPPVEALMAARAGFARGAYEASRSAALGSAPQLGAQPAGPT